MPEPDFEQAHYCWRCGQPVVVTGAQFCKECAAPLADGHFFALNPGFNPVLAAVLSIVPGLGHMYKGRPARGVMWFFGVASANYGVGFDHWFSTGALQKAPTAGAQTCVDCAEAA